MLAKIQAFLARVRLRWHALMVALVGALPVLLDQLQVIDLKPILHKFGLSDEVAALLIGLMPFYLAFIKPMLTVEAPKQ
jgi:hypothetical protein